jgi:predicted short-subunit dehydrogenase-like oxidoreductase (DUF2520 family)
MALPIIGIIGVGKVGEALARLLYRQGYSIGAIYNRTYDKTENIAQQIESLAVHDMQDVIKDSDLIILSVSDDAIQPIAEDLIQSQWQGKGIIHVSGAASLDGLQLLRDVGAMVGSLHPAFPFSSVESSLEGLVGATFAIEYSHDVLRDWLLELINILEGQVIEIPSGKKAQYHLALTLASNYMVTLYAVAEGLLADFSDDAIANRHALETLMSATMSNLIEQGVPDALTGALVRADTGTIQKHLDTLADNPLIHETYIKLAKLSYPMLIARGIDINEITELLKQEVTHASNDT